MGAKPRRKNGTAGLLTPEPSSQPQVASSSPLRSKGAYISIDEEDEDDLITPVNKTRTDHATDDEEDDDVILTSTNKRNKPALFGKDDADELITPASKKRKISGGVTSLRRSARFNSSPTPARSTPASSASPVVVSDDGGIGEAESTDEEGDVLASAPTRRRKTPGKKNSSFGRSLDPIGDDWEVADDEEIEYISSDPETVHRRCRRRRSSKKEQEELEADLEDLRDSDSDVQDSARKRRTRGGPVTTQRDGDQEHFDLLKRRRAGERIPRVYDSEEEQTGSTEGADIELIGRPTQLDDDEEGSVHSSIDTDPEEEQAEQVEDDWIDDDDEEVDNDRRPQSGVPLQFTRFATAKPRELFFHVVEWLIKNRIAPAFPRDDEIYELAFRKVNDEVSAQAGSRLISSAWNAEFKYTVLARPEIAISPKPVEDDIHCDACNKTNHPAKYDVLMTGQPYYAKTLEPIEVDSEDEDRDGMDVDEQGRLLASETRHFYLGTHCAANAQMGHALTHWKYHLNEKILQYLTEQDVLSDQQIVAREKKNKKKREKEAETIVDMMEETGKVRELWREFQRDLKDSMLGMVDYDAGKGARTTGRVGVVQARLEDGTIKEWNGDKYRTMRAYSTESD